MADFALIMDLSPFFKARFYSGGEIGEVRASLVGPHIRDRRVRRGQPKVAGGSTFHFAQYSSYSLLVFLSIKKTATSPNTSSTTAADNLLQLLSMNGLRVMINGTIR